MPGGTSSWASNFIRCFIDLSLIFASLEPQKSLKFIGFYKCFWFSALTRWDPFWMRFWYQLGSIFLPQILQNPTKIWSQEWFDFSSIFASNFYRFWLRFGNQVGAMWANFFELKRPKRPPRRPKKPPRSLPRVPQDAKIIAFPLIFEGF